MAAPRRVAWLVAVGCALASPVRAGSEAPAPDPKRPVDLDRLLKLPSSLDYSVEIRGGMTPGEWRGRFRRIRDALESEREALRQAEARLEEVAADTSPWQVAPALPGVGSGEAPLDFQLRQEIRRHRDEIQHLERQLRELEIEANLLNVPEDWRH